MGFCFYTFLYVAVLTLVPPETPLAQRALMATGMPLVSIAVSLTLGVLAVGPDVGGAAGAMGLCGGDSRLCDSGPVLGAGLGDGAGRVLALSGLGDRAGRQFCRHPGVERDGRGAGAGLGAVAQLGNLGTTTGTPVLAALLVWGGPWALVAAALVLCAAGIAVHAVQARRRQMRST